MQKDIKVVLIDGYIDDPAALGVPPYISPMIRAVAGASADAGADVEYISVDMIRRGRKIPDADVSVVLSGNTVPGKYLRSMPMSLKELGSLVPKLRGWKLIGGSAASSPVAEMFDFAVKDDLAASLYDGMTGKEVNERYRTLDEWNRWMLLGADMVSQHQDFPHPLIVEIETYRGCHRYGSGGCSYCIEPLKGRPLMRPPGDILAEAEKLRSIGIRNIRVGGQTCIISYGSECDSAVPRPNPEALNELFRGLKSLDFSVLHVDNANPAVISSYPDESAEIIRTLSDCCTSGNVLALGLESADPVVFRENNLNSTSEQLMDAVRMINKIGGRRGETGLPALLPGINLICGLDGETEDTYRLNTEVLKKILDEGLMVRRINIRQVMPLRKEFGTKIKKQMFRSFKESVRSEIDQEMLKRMIPGGTVLKDVYMELHDGNTTFGRQIGTYPILVGVPYKLDLETSYDITVTDWGYRSITGISTPFDVNGMPMSAIEGLPGIGKKRAARIVMGRPYGSVDDLRGIIEDDAVFESLRGILSVSRRS
ncbi:MAG: radical SAM protein [Candidatus Methanoplasma sp.]|jgi:radical SAM superfamily enzyme with C-terminal helix-hairpin-helix motif|nr:radical SAM protein [Candidatus Methanoplasma sp.]